MFASPFTNSLNFQRSGAHEKGGFSAEMGMQDEIFGGLSESDDAAGAT
jgi:hypothetical protein